MSSMTIPPSQGELKSSGRDWAEVIVPLLLLIVLCLAYLPAVGGSFLWDDDAHVTRTELRSAEGLKRIWLEIGATQQYYPLLHTAFWVENQLWDDNALGYHVANLSLHAL